MGNGVRGLLLRGYEVDVMRSGGLSNVGPFGGCRECDPAQSRRCGAATAFE
nr:hypothetical protein JVH1_2184 [Rhodococcus sp. JVH1]